MPTKKKAPKRAVGRERAIALALVEVIEAHNSIVADEKDGSARFQKSLQSAEKVLIDHGFAGLESISSRIATIEAQLKNAYAALDGKRVQALGRELDRATKGLPPVKKKPVLVEKKKEPEAA